MPQYLAVYSFSLGTRFSHDFVRFRGSQLNGMYLLHLVPASPTALWACSQEKVPGHEYCTENVSLAILDS